MIYRSTYDTALPLVDHYRPGRPPLCRSAASARFCPAAPFPFPPNPALKYSVMIPKLVVPQGKRRTERLRNRHSLVWKAPPSPTPSIVPASHRRLCESAASSPSSRAATVSCANPQSPSSPGGHRQFCEFSASLPAPIVPPIHRQLCEPGEPRPRLLRFPASHRQLCGSPSSASSRAAITPKRPSSLLPPLPHSCSRRTPLSDIQS